MKYIKSLFIILLILIWIYLIPFIYYLYNWLNISESIEVTNDWFKKVMFPERWREYPIYQENNSEIQYLLEKQQEKDRKVFIQEINWDDNLKKFYDEKNENIKFLNFSKLWEKNLDTLKNTSYFKDSKLTTFKSKNNIPEEKIKDFYTNKFIEFEENKDSEYFTNCIKTNSLDWSDRYFTFFVLNTLYLWDIISKNTYQKDYYNLILKSSENNPVEIISKDFNKIKVFKKTSWFFPFNKNYICYKKVIDKSNPNLLIKNLIQYKDFLNDLNNNKWQENKISKIIWENVFVEFQKDINKSLNELKIKDFLEIYLNDSKELLTLINNYYDFIIKNNKNLIKRSDKYSSESCMNNEKDLLFKSTYLSYSETIWNNEETQEKFEELGKIIAEWKYENYEILFNLYSLKINSNWELCIINNSNKKWSWEIREITKKILNSNDKELIKNFSNLSLKELDFIINDYENFVNTNQKKEFENQISKLIKYLNKNKKYDLNNKEDFTLNWDLPQLYFNLEYLKNYKDNYRNIINAYTTFLTSKNNPKEEYNFLFIRGSEKKQFKFKDWILNVFNY